MKQFGSVNKRNNLQIVYEAFLNMRPEFYIEMDGGIIWGISVYIRSGCYCRFTFERNMSTIKLPEPHKDIKFPLIKALKIRRTSDKEKR